MDFVVLASGVLAFALLQSLVIPVLPTIQHALGTTQADVTWVLTAYLLAASICTPVVGRLGDMTGKKRMFVLALATLAVGCLVSALATSLPVMIAGRVVQGIGGGVMPLAFGIVRDRFAEEDVPSAISVIASMGAAGSGVGLVLAGPLVDALGPDWLFWAPFVVLVVACVAAQAVLSESPRRPGGRVNWAAAGLLSAWLVALLLPVSQGSSWGWTSPAVLGLLAAALVLAVAWIVVESRSRSPLIDMRMMRLRAVWTTNLVALMVGLAMYASFAFLSQFLQTPPSAGYGFGATVTESGLLVLPQTAVAFLVGLVAGRLGQHYGSKNVLLAGIATSVLGYVLFALLHDTPWQVVALTTLMGGGSGVIFSSMSNLVVTAVPRSQTGVASGMNANIRTIGGSIGSAVMAAVVTSHPGPTGLPTESGYVNGFLVLTGGLVLAWFAALLVPAVRRDAVSREEPDVPLRHPAGGLVAGGSLVGDEA
ncbi:MFS transporter [Blastococcus sp. SYSU D00820]